MQHWKSVKLPWWWTWWWWWSWWWSVLQCDAPVGGAGLQRNWCLLCITLERCCCRYTTECCYRILQYYTFICNTYTYMILELWYTFIYFNTYITLELCCWYDTLLYLYIYYTPERWYDTLLNTARHWNQLHWTTVLYCQYTARHSIIFNGYTL